MVKNGLYNDSLGRADFHSNPYDARQQSNPALVKYRMEQYAKTQDTIESSLENQIFKRLKNGQFFLEGENYQFLMQLARLALMTLFLPPYLLFYRLPAWLLKKGFPKLGKTTGKLVQPTIRLMKAAAEIAKKLMKIAVETGAKLVEPLVSSIQAAIGAVRKTLEFIKQKTSETLETIASPFRALQKAVAFPFQKINAFFEKVSTIKNKIAEFREMLRERLLNFPSLATEKLQELWNKFNNQLDVTANYIKEAFAPVAALANKLGAQLEKGFDKTIRVPIRAVKETVAQITSKLKILTSPAVEWIGSRNNELQELLRRTKSKFNDFKDKRIEAVKNKFKGSWNAFTARTAQAGSVISVIGQEIASIIPQPVLSLFAPLVYVVGGVARVPLKVYRSRKKIKERIKQFREKVRKGIVLLSRWISRTGDYLHKGYKSFEKWFKKIAKKVLKVSVTTFLVVATAVRGAFLLFRLMLAWVSALIRYSFYLLKQASA